MKVNQYPQWRTAAETFWVNEIETEAQTKQSALGYSDTEKSQIISTLTTTMTSQLSSLDQKITEYENDDTKRDEFVGILLSIGTYATCKDMIATPEAPVKPLSSLPSSDLRDLFAWWLEDLPAYESLFVVTIEEELDPDDPMATPELVYSLDDGTYSSAYSAISGYASDDISRFNALNQESGSALRDRGAYLMYAGPEAVIQRSDLSLNEIVLTQYHAQEILDKFGWIVKGLSS